MKKILFAVSSLLLLCQGCYIDKINGTEKLVKIDGPQGERVAISRIHAIVPKLELKRGKDHAPSLYEFSLTVRGVFMQQYEVHKVGNQYRAMGLFPGFDYYCEVHSVRDCGSYYFWSCIYPINVGIGNCIFGIPTISTLFESLSPQVAKLAKPADPGLFDALGVVGTYKYESDPYDVNTGLIAQKVASDDMNSLRCKGYRILIGRQEYKDIDGVVKIPFVPKDDIVTFRLLDVPANIDGVWRETCKSVLQNDYVVHVSK